MKNKKVWIAAGVLSLALGVGLYSSGTMFRGAFTPTPTPTPTPPTTLKFSVSLASSPVSQTVTAGETDVQAVGFKFKSGLVPVTITNLTFTGHLDGNGDGVYDSDGTGVDAGVSLEDVITSVSLYDPTAGTTISLSDELFSSAGTVSFHGLTWSIPTKATTKRLVVLVDTSSTLPENASFSIDIADVSADVVAEDSTGTSRAPTITDAVNGGTSPRVVVTVEPVVLPSTTGTITVALSYDPVLDAEAVAGDDSLDDPLLVARYKLYASGEDFTVTEMQFENDSDDTNPYEDDDAISTVILKYPLSLDAPTVLDGRASTVLIAGKASFTGLDMAVPESMSGDENAIDVEVYVVTNEITTGGAFSSGAQIEMDFDASDGFHAIGLTSGTTVTESSSYFGTTADVDANEITLVEASYDPEGTITVASSDDPVLDGVAIAGDDSEGDPLLVARYKLYASGEDFTVTEMQFMDDSNADNSYEDPDAISTVILKYPLSLDAPTVLDGMASTILIDSKASFTGLSMAVPESMSGDENAIDVEVYVVTNEITTGGAFSSGAQIEMDFDASDEFHAIGLTSGATVTESSSYFGTTADVDANEIALYKALPSFAIDDSASSPCSGDLVESSSTNVYCFSVTATEGAIALYKLNFAAFPNFLNTGVNPSELSYPDGWSITEYDASGLMGSSLGSGTWASNAVAITFTSEEIVSGGTTSYYVVQAPITYTGSTDTSSLSVYLQQDTSYFAPWSTTRVSGNIIWSDRSASGHSTSTADWTNGYKLDGLPTTTLVSRE